MFFSRAQVGRTSGEHSANR